MRNTRLLALLLSASMIPVVVRAQVPFGEQSYEYDPAEVLPGATELVRAETYWRAHGPDGALLGYVFLTDDLVHVPGYSGHTINTLVGMDRDGTITGVKIVQHSEPIVLIGLSEKAIRDFVQQYVGKNARDRIIIGRPPGERFTAVDGISGATVTAVAENATILEAARLVARSEGLLKASELRRRKPSEEFDELTWPELVERGAIGSIVESEGMATVDVSFAVIDSPAVGKNLLGERYYALVRERMEREHRSALYIGGKGDLSFKGAGFARGGIFDRFSIEQNGSLFVVKDVDYVNLTAVQAENAPHFQEGGVFFLPEEFDPTRPFTFQLVIPYQESGKKVYSTYAADYQLPERFIEVETPFWLTRWRQAESGAVFLSLLILAAAFAFTFRLRLTAHRKKIHYTVATLSAAVVGLVLKAQPSTTQILTLTSSAAERRFPLSTFLSEPLIFLFWVSIVLSLIVWGRGFFCGWLCPYGAMLEVLHSLWKRLASTRLFERLAWEPPRWFRYGKYATFLVILAVSFASLPLAETLDEIEPFKTFVLRLARPAGFVAYFLAVTVVSVASYRFFCRFLCPLGGALALPSVRPAHRLLRYDFCSQCRICARGCEPRAIDFSNGRIDYRECLQCWDCQKTALDPEVCPVLIMAEKKEAKEKVLVGALLLALLGGSSPAGAETRRARPAEGGLSQAIARSADGDVILLEPGVYRENLVIDRRLVIRAPSGAIIDAQGRGHAVIIESPGVTLEGLEIRNCGSDMDRSDAAVRVEKSATGARILGNQIEGCRFGIWIAGANDVQIERNHIQGIEEITQNERGDCIHLWDAHGTVVRENKLSSCRDGIYLELASESVVERNRISRSRYSVHTMWCDRSRFNENRLFDNLVGLALMFSTQIEARENVLHNNATHGMLWIQITRGRVTDNTVIGNSKGIFVYNSLYNTLSGNFIARNNLGIHYWGGSEENEITGNALVQNQIQLKFEAARDQRWPGNFWSDYSGWDVDADGQGDAPYRSSTLVDGLLWDYPVAKLLLTGAAFQLLAVAEREFPLITVSKVVDESPLMAPPVADWSLLLKRYPPRPVGYFGSVEKLPHVPGGRR